LSPLGYNVRMTQTQTTPPPQTYFVKCDECRETMRFTDSVRESAEGGRCEKCRAEIAAKLAKAKAPRFSAYDREIAAYEADIYKAKRNARVAKKGGLR
jgi:predicted nucleic acid-binding Zn ribbon protein